MCQKDVTEVQDEGEVFEGCVDDHAMQDIIWTHAEQLLTSLSCRRNTRHSTLITNMLLTEYAIQMTIKFPTISRKLLGLETSNLVHSFVWGMPKGRTNNSVESGRGLGHVTPTIYDIRSNISLKILELETSNLVCSFVWAMPSRSTNNFP